MDTIKINEKINSLEDLIINKGFDKERLTQLKHSFITKHNYITKTYELIAFFDDYLTHLTELNKTLGGTYEC